MKVLIDDERILLPNGSKPDIILRTYDSAMYFMIMEEEVLGQYQIYLDHDLGSAKTGYDLISQLEIDIDKYPHAQLPEKIVCVSDNGPGRMRIEQVIQKLYGKVFYD